LLTAIAIAYVRLPDGRVIAVAGAVSCLYFLARIADDGTMRFVAVCAACAVSLIAAYALYRSVEVPARQWAAQIRYKNS